MRECDVWKNVPNVDFENAMEGMEKLVMNRLYELSVNLLVCGGVETDLVEVPSHRSWFMQFLLAQLRRMILNGIAYYHNG